MHSLNCSMRSNGGATLYTKVWKRRGGGILISHSCYFFTRIPRPVPLLTIFRTLFSFPIPHPIPLPQRQSNPVSRQHFPNVALCFGQIPDQEIFFQALLSPPPPPPLTLSLFVLIFAPSPQSKRLEPRLADANITFAEFKIFFSRIVDSTDVRFSQPSNWFSLTLHSFFGLLLQAIWRPGHKLLFHIQAAFWLLLTSYATRID